MKRYGKFFLALATLSVATQALAVSTSDCVPEQKAYYQASIDNVSPSYEEEAGRRVYSGDVNDDHSIAWLIRDTLYRETVSEATSSAEYHRNAISDFSRDPYYVAKYRLSACFLEVRVRELSGGGKPITSKSTESLTADDCPASNAAAANRAMDEIDAKVAAFMEASAGRPSGEATPSLQVVMWASDRASKLIAKYCPESAKFIQMQAQLQQTFDTAKNACLAIQTDPKFCGPSPP